MGMRRIGHRLFQDDHVFLESSRCIEIPGIAVPRQHPDPEPFCADGAAVGLGAVEERAPDTTPAPRGGDRKILDNGIGMRDLVSLFVLHMSQHAHEADSLSIGLGHEDRTIMSVAVGDQEIQIPAAQFRRRLLAAMEQPLIKMQFSNKGEDSMPIGRFIRADVYVVDVRHGSGMMARVGGNRKCA